jgi:outer membrane protein assembly factor BamE (lipoprotein component of BamABCDE complex)
MKSILIFAGVAGLAAAIAIYFVTEGNKDSKGGNYITDAAVDEYDRISNAGDVSTSPSRGYNAMS